MKVLCPLHNDTNPSLHVYDNNAFCFVCEKSVKLTDLGIISVPKERYVEDLKAKRQYIESLPAKEIRGFNLHYDDLGYYITWPDCDYYKLRLHEGQTRYKNPSGHTQPLLWVNVGKSNNLFLVEGELNAMSMGVAFPEFDVCSAGSAGDMTRRNQDINLQIYYKYNKINIVVDEDSAGAIAAIKLKLSLIKTGIITSIVMMQKDCNEWHTCDGKEALRQEVEKALSRRL